MTLAVKTDDIIQNMNTLFVRRIGVRLVSINGAEDKQLFSCLPPKKSKHQIFINKKK
jgi:hypothetical protein